MSIMTNLHTHILIRDRVYSETGFELSDLNSLDKRLIYPFDSHPLVPNIAHGFVYLLSIVSPLIVK